MSESAHRVELDCARCGMSTVHEVAYAGRILVRSTCTRCGATVRREGPELRSTYLHDLEHRLVTKPGRLLVRALRQPATFARTLPGAILRQPAKLAAEIREILRR